MDKTLTRVRDGHTYAGQTDLIVMTCPACGVTYAMPTSLQENAYARGERKITWFCPNGHELGYNGPSEEEKARKKAEADARWYEERFRAERDLHAHTSRQLAAQKAATTRAKKRHAAGVCPCCNRTFQQLQRHMASKHPDYDASKG
jgi:protein-arginine kinase activator protein McsA